MYRIIIRPSDGQWIMQLSCCMGIFWKQIGDRSFENYASARQFADQLGLDAVYRDWNDRPAWFGVAQ